MGIARKPTLPNSWPKSSASVGVRFLAMDLTYILRAGEPVARDRHMAIFYANLIMSHVEAKRSGVMAAYTMANSS